MLFSVECTRTAGVGKLRLAMTIRSPSIPPMEILSIFRVTFGVPQTELVASSLIKTGDGEQILTGNVNLAGASSGWADILEGTLTFNPDSGRTQSVEYVKNSSGTPTLKLDNTGIGSGQIVELGFANTTSAQTFSGGVTLSGSNGTSNKIKIASGATDYSKEQIFSGAITGSNTLVKDGAGRLVLTGDSTSSFTGNITVDDGTLVIGNGSGDGSNLDSDNTITINKGKLEIADNESVTLTAQGGSGKSIIGGKGTISTATIGDGAGEIDYISPVEAFPLLLSPTKRQLIMMQAGVIPLVILQLQH